jgi:glycosyltransferase involved in cell wall biosynthesis
VGQLFDAIKILRSDPVDFTFAGPIGVRIPDEISKLPNVHFLGPVDKATAEKLYRDSDVFLFPTLSDGFGLTQLEALGHGLPVISSLNCGRIIEHKVNGLLMTEVTPASIAEAVDRCARDRALVGVLCSRAHVPEGNRPAALVSALSMLPVEQ